MAPDHGEYFRSTSSDFEGSAKVLPTGALQASVLAFAAGEKAKISDITDEFVELNTNESAERTPALRNVPRTAGTPERSLKSLLKRSPNTAASC